MRSGAVLAGLGLLGLVAMCGKPQTTVAVADNVVPPAVGQSTNDRVTVTAARAACRARPSAKARSVVRLSRGARLDVIERSGDWVKVSPTGDACWVATAQLDQGAASTASTVSTDAMPRATSLYSPAARRSAGRRNRSSQAKSFYGGGACPCGSGRICIGPRGGRYCITSGGNKEYGR